MATDDADRRVPTQDEYELDVHEREWIELPSGFEFRVQTVPPLKLLRVMDDHGVLFLLRDDADLDPEDMASGQVDFMGFVREMLLPNVVRPAASFGDAGPDDGFDLDSLSDDDFQAVVQGIMGGDEQDVEKAAEKFR